MQMRASIMFSLLLFSCGGTDFAASTQPARKETPSPSVNNTPPQNPFQPYVPTPYNPTLPVSPNNPLPQPTLPTPVVRPPTFIQPNDNAVQRGSFTVWTNPSDPRPGQYYDVIIEVKLPSNIYSYRESDLTGCIIGTDKYVYALGRGEFFGPKKAFANCSQVYSESSAQFEPGYRKSSFQSAAGLAQLRIPIPGAEQMVRDRIEIHSQILNESQTVTIEF